MTKKRIKNFFLFGFTFFLLWGCSGKKTTTSVSKTDSTKVIQKREVNHVIGIGKIEPKNGIIKLSSSVNGIVDSVYHSSGDFVKKGGVILQLEHSQKELNQLKIENQIQTQKELIQSKKTITRKYKTQLEHQKEKLETNKKLLQSGAAKQETVNQLETKVSVLKTEVTNSKQVVQLNIAKLEELKTQLKIAKTVAAKYSLKAPTDGTIIRIDAPTGSAIQAFQSYATFAPEEPLVVRGEVDEMFANQVEVGQKVKVHFIGNQNTVTTGKIISLSSGLSNKSIFTDEPGEQQDRRVRRFKALLDSSANLLINTKVACDIKTK